MMETAPRYSGTRCAALIWFTVLAGPATALPDRPGDLARMFATCAGRMTAMMEFQWSFDGAASERTGETLRDFDVLLEAALGPGATGRDALNWRIDAKMAHSRLLNLATFGRDDRLRSQASRAAELYLSECEDVLLK
ncbi:hypothetical protein [Puniceibacterium confluentis]|uniref:hypothetical protein n=1 Tax=Puniceibacterium confluentis TaxID=1958944 RepID=UPI0011B3E339|nr:hypothetical protein [Puniceibacterium confluentis]